MSKDHAPLSRKEEEEKTASENSSPPLMSMKKGSVFAKYDDLAGLKRKAFASMFKKKSKVSQPGDASEIQADAVAKAVTEGNANAAQVELQNDVHTGEITAKANDVSIETPPGFEEQLSKMQGGGLPLPDDKKENLEEMLGTDLDHVRLHTGSDAKDLSKGINARAFATGDDIFFADSVEDEELLAHEVAHVVQGGGELQTSTFNRAPGDKWKTILDTELFNFENNVMVVAYKLTANAKLEEIYYEYNDQTNAYYYVSVTLTDQNVVTGFVKRTDVEQLPVQQVIIDPEKDREMRNGIRYKYVLTKEQKDYFNWPAVIEAFRALPEHASVDQKYLDQWARKQLKNGWKIGDAVPDLTAYHAEFGEPKVYEITGELVPTLYVYWYAENHATIRHQLLDWNKHNYKGFWVFVDSISGYESELQQNDSFGKFYQENPVSQIDLTNLFLYIADKKIVVEHTQADIQKLGIDSEEFRVIVENTQDVLYNGVRISGYGMYTLQTRTLIAAAVVELQKAEHEKLLAEIASYNQEALAVIPQADADILTRMSGSEAAVLFDLRNRAKTQGGGFNNLGDGTKKFNNLQEEYWKAASNSSFKSSDEFENAITSLQNVFQRRATAVANNILNNTENVLTKELSSYGSDKDRLEGLAILLYQAKVEYENYLYERWEGDKMDHVMQQNESYSFKGELNDNDRSAISSLGTANAAVAQVAQAGHPILDYFIQPGRQDELGELLGLTYHAYSYQQERSDENYKNPYASKWMGTFGGNKKTEVVNTVPLYSAIQNAVYKINGNIATTRQNLIDSPKKVWDLDNVVAFTFDEMRLVTGSVPYEMINEELERRQDAKMFKEIFLAVVNIGLGILALSGIAAPFAILAGLGAAAISTYTYLDHKATYEFQKAASGTGTSAGKSLLSQEPDAFWLYLDMLAIGIDVFIALKIIAAVGKTAKLFKLANATEDAVTKAKLLDELDVALRTNIAKQADELIDAIRIQLDDLKHVEDIRARDYSVNEIKGKVEAPAGPKNYSKTELNRIVANAEEIGDVRVWRGKEAEQFLDQQGANAMYISGEAGKPGALVIRETASRNVIIEELLHLEQHRVLGFKELSTPEMLRMEIEAQDALLRYGKNNKWTTAELDEIEGNKQYWLDKKKKHETNPNEVEEELSGLKNRRQPTADELLDLKNTRAKVDNILSQYVDEVNEIYPNSVVGYRGSLATGFKHDPPIPFTSNSFDVDGFIVNNQLAEDIGKYSAWRDAYDIDEFHDIINALDKKFRELFPGYKKEPFTFKVWTTDEFRRIVRPEGCKTF